MELHEFMCPTVCNETPKLRADPKVLSSYPAKMAFVCDFENDRLIHQIASSDKNEPVQLLETDTSEMTVSHLAETAGPKASRSTELIEQLRGLGATWLCANMEDGAPFSPEIYFGHPVNFIQYVRRLGDPFGVLWRLPTYYEPSPQIGLVMNPDELRDKVAFKDKIPRVVWRGAATGEYWDNPFSFRKLTVLWSGPDPVEPLDYWSERYAAVQKSLMHPELFDCRFVIRRKARKRLGLKPNLEGFQHPGFSRERTREWMLRFKYQLCLPGNDVSTQLYWVIATNSIAFKTQCEFDSLADFFLRPWVHYVPIARDLHDLADKLAFCEANPDFCLALIERANQAYADMLNPTLWDAAEKTVLDRLGWLSA